MNIESAAVNILKRGVELDTKKRYTEALVCYQEGLQILVDKMRGENDDSTKAYLRKKVEEYMNRAETIKKLVLQQKEAGQFHEQVHIENNSTGHSYKTLFGRFLDDDVNYVSIEDPYIRTFHQCQNFLRLCELLVRSCHNLQLIELITSRDNKTEGDQREWLTNLSNDLSKYKIKLIVKFSETLHDRLYTPLRLITTKYLSKTNIYFSFNPLPNLRWRLRPVLHFRVFLLRST